MTSSRCIVFSVSLLLSAIGTLAAQGLHWSYQTRITQTYDIVPGQNAEAPAFASVPYPLYPFEMVRSGITGTAQLQFRVRTDGAVENVRVLKASQKEFSEAAVAAVKTWRFLPLAKNAPNYPTSVEVVCAFKFELPDE
jgi:TonB family protein